MLENKSNSVSVHPSVPDGHVERTDWFPKGCKYVMWIVRNHQGDLPSPGRKTEQRHSISVCVGDSVMKVVTCEGMKMHQQPICLCQQL